MYARRPSSDTTTSCGSSPAGTRATGCRLAASTITSELSLLSRTRSAADGVSAARAPTAASRQTNRHKYDRVDISHTLLPANALGPTFVLRECLFHKACHQIDLALTPGIVWRVDARRPPRASVATKCPKKGVGASLSNAPTRRRPTLRRSVSCSWERSRDTHRRL